MTDFRGTGWFKSSHSGGATDNCVEVNLLRKETVGVRDSKNADAAALWFPPAAWTTFIAKATAEGIIGSR